MKPLSTLIATAVLASCSSTEVQDSTTTQMSVVGADFDDRSFATDPSAPGALSHPLTAFRGPGASGFVASEGGASVEVTAREVGDELVLTIDGIETRYDRSAGQPSIFGNASGTIEVLSTSGDTLLLRRTVSGATLADTYVDLWSVVGIETPVANLPANASYSGQLVISGGTGPARTFDLSLDADFNGGDISGALSHIASAPSTSIIEGEIDRGRFRADVSYAEGAGHVAGGGPTDFAFTGEMTGAAYGWTASTLAGTVTGQVTGTTMLTPDVVGHFSAR